MPSGEWPLSAFFYTLSPPLLPSHNATHFKQQAVGSARLSASGCPCRYSTALEATGISHTPHCMPIDATELQDFCVDSGYNVRLERSGTFFTPPSFNVHLTDWERAARLRYYSGIFGDMSYQYLRALQGICTSQQRIAPKGRLCPLRH